MSLANRYRAIRNQHQRRAHRCPIDERALAQRRDDADGQAPDHPHDGRPDRERGGRRQPFLDQFGDGLLAVVAVAEVEMEENALEVLPELGGQRFVEPQHPFDFLDQLRLRVAPGAQHRRVARGQHAEEDERQRADDDQQRDAPKQAADDVGGHLGALLRAWVRE